MRLRFPPDQKTRLPATGLVIPASGWSGDAETFDPARRGDRGAGARQGAEAALALAAAGEARIEGGVCLKAEARRAAAAQSAGGLPLEASVARGRGVVALQAHESGRIEWLLPQQRGETLRFEVQPLREQERAPTADRGPITAAIRACVYVISWATDGLVGDLACTLARRFEATQRNAGLVALDAQGDERPFAGEPLGQRAPMLIHGTFSTPRACFGDWLASPERAGLAAAYDGPTLAFGHPTLSLTLEDNLKALIAAWPRDLRVPEIDLLAHSRGGLLAHAVAAAAERGELPFRVRRLALVGAPHAGTPIAVPARLVDFINATTQLLVDLPDTTATILLESLFGAVKTLAGGGLGGLPGIALQRPESAMGASSLCAVPGGTEVLCVAARFGEPAMPAGTPAGLRAAAAVARGFFDGPSDGVIPAASAAPGDLATSFPGCRAERFAAPSPATHHMSFFACEDVRRALAGFVAR